MEMEIFIRCIIDEKTCEKILKENNCTEEEVVERMSSLLNEDVLSTLEDNQELFCQIDWSINEPLP